MYEFKKKNGKVFTSKSVGTGPSSHEKRIYRAAVSQRLRNTAVYIRRTVIWMLQNTGPTAFISIYVKACKLNMFYVNVEVYIFVGATCLFRNLTGSSTKLSSVPPGTYWDNASIRHDCFLLNSFHLSVIVPLDLRNGQRGKVSRSSRVYAHTRDTPELIQHREISIE